MTDAKMTTTEAHTMQRHCITSILPKTASDRAQSLESLRFRSIQLAVCVALDMTARHPWWNEALVEWLGHMVAQGVGRVGIRYRSHTVVVVEVVAEPLAQVWMFYHSVPGFILKAAGSNSVQT